MGTERDVVDAEFREMKDRREETKSLATLETFQLFRHDQERTIDRLGGDACENGHVGRRQLRL